jgi:antitoxin (DNA-binding transcriptional repressor) of toxin-antitoxin stability system
MRKAVTETKRVGIREFRDNLASYVLESDGPVAITRHGDTVGLYIPVRRKRTEAEWARFDAAAARVDEMLKASGVTEEELVEDIKRMRAVERSAARR